MPFYPENDDEQEYDYFPIPSDEQLLENVRNKEKEANKVAKSFKERHPAIAAAMDHDAALLKDLNRYHEIETELDTIYVGLFYDEPAWLTRLGILLAERREIRNRIKL